MTSRAVPLPQSAKLTTPEIKRRVRALTECAREAGLDVAGIRMSPDGEITVVDKSALPAKFRRRCVMSDIAEADQALRRKALKANGLSDQVRTRNDLLRTAHFSYRILNNTIPLPSLDVPYLRLDLGNGFL